MKREGKEGVRNVYASRNESVLYLYPHTTLHHAEAKMLRRLPFFLARRTQPSLSGWIRSNSSTGFALIISSSKFTGSRFGPSSSPPFSPLGLPRGASFSSYTLKTDASGVPEVCKRSRAKHTHTHAAWDSHAACAGTLRKHCAYDSHGSNELGKPFGKHMHTHNLPRAGLPHNRWSCGGDALLQSRIPGRLST